MPSFPADTACLLTYPKFSVGRNPYNLSHQTETYKKPSHSVILRDVITISLSGGLCWNRLVPTAASKGKKETEDHRAVQRWGLRGDPTAALSLPLRFCSQGLVGESLQIRKPCGSAFSLRSCNKRQLPGSCPEASDHSFALLIHGRLSSQQAPPLFSPDFSSPPRCIHFFIALPF